MLSCAWTALIKLEQNSVVTVGAIQIGCRSQSFSYDLLMVSGHRSPANAVPSGVAERRLSHVGWVSVVGSDFGSADSTATSREHSTAAQRSIWVSDSALLSRAAAGVAASRIAILTSGVSVSSCTDVFSFQRVSLQREYSRMLPFGGAGGFPKWIANGPATDGPAQVVTLAGSGMSFADYTPKATISTYGTDSQATLWISESAVQAKAVPGAGEFGVVKITVAISQGTITNSWTYDRPTISSLLLRNGVLQGNFVMLAYGANFGAEQVGFTAGAKTGDTSCEGTRWLSRTAVLCVVPSGLGGGIKFSVTCLVIEGCATYAFSFDAPQGSVLAGRTNAVSTGSVSLTLLGINFAARNASPMPRIAGTSAESTVWISDSHVKCALGSGARSTHAGTLTVSNLIITRSQLLTYEIPTAIKESRSNFAGLGKETMSIVGSGFSHSDRSLNLLIGGSASERTDWESETSLMTRLPYGTGTTKTISITSGDRVGSKSFAGTYDSPEIVGMSFTYFFANPFFPFTTTFQRFNMPSYPIGLEMPAYKDSSRFRGSIYLTGSEMLGSDHTVRSRITSTGCEATRWLSNTHLQCRVASGWLGSRKTQITGGQGGHSQSTTTAMLSFDVPAISVVLGTNLPTYLSHCTLAGNNFGIQRISANMRSAGTAFEKTLWQSSTTLRGAISTAIITDRIDNIVLVTAGSQVGSISTSFSYDSQIMKRASTNQPTTGSAAVFVVGRGLGAWDQSVRVRHGSSSCEQTSWKSESSLECRKTAGVHAADVIITLNRVIRTSTSVLSYDRPMMSSSMSSNIAPPDYGDTLQLVKEFGHNFATSDYTAGFRTSMTASRASVWISESMLLCRSAIGVKGTLNVSRFLSLPLSLA